MPGFTLLRLYDVCEWRNTEWYEKLIDINDDGLFLPNKTWKRFMNRNNDVINGPCFSDPLGMMDQLLLLVKA
jgi:hypothetical protein